MSLKITLLAGLAMFSGALVSTAPAAAEGETQLFGIYGKHDVHDCPLFNRQSAENVVAISKADLAPLFEKYEIVTIRDQYHSALEHSFLWVVETKNPHALEEFAIEIGAAGWNELTIVPLITFADGVVPDAKRRHKLK